MKGRIGLGAWIGRVKGIADIHISSTTGIVRVVLEMVHLRLSAEGVVVLRKQSISSSGRSEKGASRKSVWAVTLETAEQDRRGPGRAARVLGESLTAGHGRAEARRGGVERGQKVGEGKAGSQSWLDSDVAPA